MTIQRILMLMVLTAYFGVSHAQGYISETIVHDGLTRAYSIYIPDSYDGTTDFPLLFNFHGGNDMVANWQFVADMRPLADTADFILVYPQARPDPSDGNSLNWLSKSPGAFDDVPFISALIHEISSAYQIDQHRIYACGYSLGGEFSYELACKLNNRIAAIGVVARTMQASPSDYCSPVHPTGVLTILGTDDFISPYNGLTFGGIEYYISAADTHEYWASQNECDPTPSMSTVSASVERYTWSTASGCAYVEELKVLGGAHDWPGSFGNMTIDASTEIWQFVSRYDINGLIDCSTTSASENNGQAEKYEVYPNPFDQAFTIAKESTQGTDFKVFTLTGELVSSGKLYGKINTIDVSELASGVYILEIDNQFIRVMKTK